MRRVITVADIMALRPCPPWPEERVRAAIGGGRVRGRVHARRVLLALKPHNARWVMSHLIRDDDASHVAWAADCAEHVLHRLADEHDEAHATAAIQAARRWVVERSYAAAYDAAYADTYAADADAYLVEHEWQVDRALDYLYGGE